MYQSKKQTVSLLKDDLEELKKRQLRDIEKEIKSKKDRNESIKNQIFSSTNAFQEYQLKKRHALRDQHKDKIEAEKKLIYAFEKEAQLLEKEEADLIEEVKQIQQEEIEAYTEL